MKVVQMDNLRGLLGIRRMVISTAKLGLQARRIVHDEVNGVGL